MEQRSRLGIIGGMGSVAAAYFFHRLVELTPALTDQDYIETFLHNNTSVPDRTDGILYGKPSPLPELKRSVEILNRMGANYIVMACMTSHYFIEQLQTGSDAVIIDGIAQTATVCRQRGFKKVGVICSTGTAKIGLFRDRLSEAEVEAIHLGDEDQKKYFTEPIYADWGVKTGHIDGRPRERLIRGGEILVENGAEAIVAGCSELPLVFGPDTFAVPLIDTIDVLLQTAIDRCFARSAAQQTSRNA